MASSQRAISVSQDALKSILHVHTSGIAPYRALSKPVLSTLSGTGAWVQNTVHHVLSVTDVSQPWHQSDYTFTEFIFRFF